MTHTTDNHCWSRQHQKLFTLAAKKTPSRRRKEEVYLFLDYHFPSLPKVSFDIRNRLVSAFVMHVFVTPLAAVRSHPLGKSLSWP